MRAAGAARRLLPRRPRPARRSRRLRARRARARRARALPHPLRRLRAAARRGARLCARARPAAHRGLRARALLARRPRARRSAARRPAVFCLYKTLPVPHGGLPAARPACRVAAPPPPLVSTLHHLAGWRCAHRELRRRGRPRGARAPRAGVARHRRPVVATVQDRHAAPRRRASSSSAPRSWSAAAAALRRSRWWSVRRRRNFRATAPPRSTARRRSSALRSPRRLPAVLAAARAGDKRARRSQALRARGIEAIDFWCAAIPRATRASSPRWPRCAARCSSCRATSRSTTRRSIRGTRGEAGAARMRSAESLPELAHPWRSRRHRGDLAALRAAWGALVDERHPGAASAPPPGCPVVGRFSAGREPRSSSRARGDALVGLLAALPRAHRARRPRLRLIGDGIVGSDYLGAICRAAEQPARWRAPSPRTSRAERDELALDGSARRPLLTRARRRLPTRAPRIEPRYRCPYVASAAASTR